MFTTRVASVCWFTILGLLVAGLPACSQDGKAPAESPGATADVGPDAPIFGDVPVDTAEVGPGGAEVASPDSAVDVAPDVKPDAAAEPGAFGYPCQDNSECIAGFCMQTAAGKVCSQLCIETCPSGFSCNSVQSGNDLIYVCVPRFLRLCDPCSVDADCKNTLLGGTQLCLSYGKEGSFCGAECKADADCPNGYACAGETLEGKTIGQCKRPSGLCSCSPSASSAHLQTTCAQTSPYGQCTGKRECNSSGLSACSASVPGAEACNGLDDDCDGSTDEDLANAPCNVTNGFGTCLGVTACQAGKATCEGQQPAKETCNGLDDDCDGAIDESSCDDGNLCTEDACNVQLGGCLFATVTKACDDGDVCTGSDTCKDGKCLGSKVSCDDGDACTLDTCGVKGCQHTAQDGAPCDDLDPCTAGDACGLSSGGTPTCDGTALADGATCTDGNGCTLAAQCQAGKCAATETKCDDGNACTDDGCEGLPGGLSACKHVYNSAACDDGNACSLGDACLAGKCVGLGKIPCDDQDPCTSDSCDAAAGCVHTAKAGTPCSDGNLCTTSDACAIDAGKGVCKGTSLACDDGNACTSDSCDSAFGCSHAFVNAPCDDGDKCSKGDTCTVGKCSPGEYVCGECVNTVDCKPSEDGNLCNGTLFCEKTTHTCQIDPTTVVQCPKPVGNGAECVTSACSPLSGKCAIQGANESASCNDGNACTNTDKCKNGACQGSYGGASCDDGNPCTQDVCDPASGCTSTVLDGVSCTDGNICTLGDNCKSGACGAGAPLSCDDGNPCTTDGCDPKAACVHNLNTLPCDDGNVCTAGDTCLNAVCTPKSALGCDDANLCTADGCDAKTGCTYAAQNGLSCNDGNACTGGDKCNGGACLGAGQVPCSDGNPCTDDACDPKSGCTFTPTTAPCSDGNACTDSDACQGGACKPGKPSDCNDANTCTQDLCDPAKGCTYVKIVDGTPCNDGDSCTVSDKCSSGICLPGTKLGCNDAEVCTTDSCNPKIGCVYVGLPEGVTCDDANVCTVGETCVKAKCTSLTKKDGDADGHVDSKCGGDDCDDASAKAYPGLKEVCDDLDNDCKSGVDDGCDDDNDDWCDANFTIAAGVVPKTCTKGGGDCDDGKAPINPGAPEKLEVDIDHRVALGTSMHYQATKSGHGFAVGADGTVHVAVVRKVMSVGAPGNRLMLYSRGKTETGWTVQPIDDTHDPAVPAVVIDAQGAAHVLYQDLGNKTLRHAVRSATGWTNELVDGKTGVGDAVAVAVAPDNTLRVAYYDAGAGDLRLASNATGAWVAATLDSNNDVGQYPAIGVAANGSVHIAYLDYTNQDLRYATDAGTPGKFQAEVLDGAGSAAGFYSSLVVDAAGKVHIAYYELLASDLRYATNASGAWKLETVDAAGTTGQLTSIATTASGLAIAYVLVDTGMVRLATGKAGAWQTASLETIQAGDVPQAGWNGQAVVVSFVRNSPGNEYERVRLATAKTGGFTYEYADAGSATDWCSSGKDMGMAGVRGKAAPGDPVAVAMTISGQSIARWDGTSYSWRTFIPTNRVRPGAMVVGGGGVVHACGAIQPSGGFGYLKGTWAGFDAPVVVDPSPQSGGACAIALDGSGGVRLTWYDAGNQVMRATTVQGGKVGSVEVPDPSCGTGRVEDMQMTSDGTQVVVYGGKNRRVASRPSGQGWSIEAVVAETTSEVALAIDPVGTWHVVYHRPTSSGDSLRYVQRKAGVWSVPAVITTAIPSTPNASGLGVTLDGAGALHIVSQASSAYMTNAFGGWSVTPLGVSAYVEANVGTASIAFVGNRLILAGLAGSCTVFTPYLLSLTYQNLVDDNCDGK